ncbi:MAG: YhcH/YjgK/YiaL family protein [Alistipes sp.]|nr:YhcH/YjgK/YiaL family protein [Alistipes sp.]
MILDSIKNAELYYSLNPRLKAAFDFLATCNPKTIAPGKHQIVGDEVFVNVMELDLKPRYEALLEVHDKYIDIQVIVGGSTKEEFGWSERKDCKKAKGEFDSERDVQFYTDEPQTFYTLREGQFTILMPEDAHAPMLGNGPIKKMIFKVLK